MKRTLSAVCVSVMLCSLAPVSFANAACGCIDDEGIANGTLIKGASSSAVYYYGYDGQRYVFPNEKVYFTWFEDFSGVQEISDENLASLTIGGNVTYKPGVRLVKIQTDPRVYAVGRGKTLRWVTSEQIARELYGPTWANTVDDVPDAFFVDYETGRPILRSTEYDASWNFYSNYSLWQFIDLLLYADVSDLPDDIPIHPNANVTSVLADEFYPMEGSLGFVTNDAREGVMMWYRSAATAEGWTEIEPSALEKLVFQESVGVKFEKYIGEERYELVVVVFGNVYSVTKGLQEQTVNTDELSPITPVYPNGDLLVAGDMGDGVTGYTAVTEESPRVAFDWFDPRLRQLSWKEIERADRDMHVIRRYERQFGGEIRNLAIFLFEYGDEEKVTFVIVAEGPLTMFDETSLEEIADTLL